MYILMYILNGLTLGMLLALTASGLSLIFGFMKVVNFAHGAIYMLGAYFALFFIGVFDNFWLALIISPIIVAGIGVLLERLLISKIAKRGELDTILLTFGFALLIENVVKMIWGTADQTYAPPALFEGTISLFGIQYPTYRLFIIVFAGLICTLLYVILYKTILGVRVRAGTEDDQMASALGVNTKLLGSVVFAIGCGLAAIAGVVSGPFLSLSPSMGGSIIITTFIVIVIGGMGSFFNTIIAAIVVGFINTLGSLVWPEFATILVYLAMILVLICKNRLPSFLKPKRIFKSQLSKEG